MTNSRNLAGILGPTLVVLSTSEALNYRIWDTSMPQIVYVNGSLLFVAGVAMVRSHNYWAKDWRVIVTILGWFALLFGLARMFFPEARQPQADAGMYAFLGLALITGLFLSAKAYLTDEGNGGRHTDT
jgi:FtsH-binding integral membrane protein